MVEELGTGRTGLLADPFLAQGIWRFLWTRESSKGKGLERKWLGTKSHQTPARIPLWSCSPSGKAEHRDKDFTENVECGYSQVFLK